jgi:hypothetical protein
VILPRIFIAHPQAQNPPITPRKPPFGCRSLVLAVLHTRPGQAHLKSWMRSPRKCHTARPSPRPRSRRPARPSRLVGLRFPEWPVAGGCNNFPRCRPHCLIPGPAIPSAPAPHRPESVR